MKQIIKELLYNAIRGGEQSGTWYRILRVENGMRWAICAAWIEYDDEKNMILHAKIAYQPTNSLLQCDYDVDWVMPSESGWVDDTELAIGSTVFDVTDDKVEYLTSEWDRIQKTYINEEVAA